MRSVGLLYKLVKKTPFFWQIILNCSQSAYFLVCARPSKSQKLTFQRQTAKNVSELKCANIFHHIQEKCSFNTRTMKVSGID